MINERMHELGSEPSVIRELFAYGLARKAEIGAENVFDFSLGNPSVPAPDAIKKTMLELLEEPPSALHGYTPAAGDPRVRTAIARAINNRYGVPATPNRVYMTVGAAASLALSLSAITQAGEEVIVISPYFPEYKVWIESVGCTCVEVPARESDFQLDLEALAHAIGSKTSAVIVNSPNNPVGVVYSRKVLEDLAALLQEKEAEFSREIYLISDEPYREIVYEDAEVVYVPTLYPRTLVCYSYSKSLSLPGERIGYVYVSNLMDNDQEVYDAIAGAGRSLGYVCAPVLFQRVIERCIDEPSDVQAYAENRALLTEGLSALGYTYIEPQGAFYLWVKSLEEDAQAFSDRAKEHELLIVASDSFGVGGWVRISYCVSPETIKNALPAFAALKASYE